MKHKLFLFIVLGVSFLIIACYQDESSVDNKQLTISLEADDYLTQSQFPFAVDDTTSENLNEIIHLGRVLFYDPALSVSGKVSCGSCHHQNKAFSDGQSISTGFLGAETIRNSPSIVNSRFSNGLFWDQSSNHLHDLVLRPIQDHIEMGFSDINDLINKIEGIEYYQTLFSNAFGHQSTITSEKIAMGLAEFCGQINSFDSDFDFGLLNANQQLGQNLFVSKGCDNCHHVVNPIFLHNDVGFFHSGPYTGGSFFGDMANIGLDKNYADRGRMEVTQNIHDDGKFKIPSMRNIALTAPYMHDGRFNTLEEVLDFYSTGIQNHDNLDHRLRSSGSVHLIELNQLEKNAIIDFLNSLTGQDIVNNTLYSDPFKY